MSSNYNWYEAQRSCVEACCRQLTAEGVIGPLAEDEGETRSWLLWELASLAEGHLHVQLDVARLSEEERLAYERRVTYHGGPLASPHGDYRRPFCLLDEDRRVGTIAMGSSTATWRRSIKAPPCRHSLCVRPVLLGNFIYATGSAYQKASLRGSFPTGGRGASSSSVTH